MNEIIGKIFGVLYPLCFFICYIPQLYVTFKYKNVEGLSLKMFALCLCGYISSCLYMLEIGFNFGMLTNAISGSICCILLIYAILKYRIKY